MGGGALTGSVPRARHQGREAGVPYPCLLTEVTGGIFYFLSLQVWGLCSVVSPGPRGARPVDGGPGTGPHKLCLVTPDTCAQTSGGDGESPSSRGDWPGPWKETRVLACDGGRGEYVRSPGTYLGGLLALPLPPEAVNAHVR